MSKRVALVTGASRGLGAALSRTLARNEFHVVAVSRTVGALEELDDSISAEGGSVSLAVLDIAQDKPIRSLCETISNRWGKLDLVAHAAIAPVPLSPAAHTDEKSLRNAIETNLVATARLISCVEPLLLRAPDGTAVFFEDDSYGKKFFGAYGSTKSAQISLAKSWKAETAKIGPTVLILKPRPMFTKCRSTFFPGQDPKALSTPEQEAERLLSKVFDGSSNLEIEGFKSERSDKS